MNIVYDRFLWEHLKKTDKPVVMYGMGNGADKILAVAERYGVEICDFFASDGFVRGHQFHGKRVLSYSEAKEKYGDMIVLLSFASSLPDVMANFYRIADECEFYAPDVPVFGDILFTPDFVKDNIEKLETVYAMLFDERSKEIYENVINYKLSGDISYLRAAESDEAEVNALIGAADLTSYADLGAYTGDTVKKMLDIAPSIKRVLALEPDARNFRKLTAYAETETRCKIEAHNTGAWSHRDTLFFDASGNRNANIGENKKGKTALVDSLDSVLAGESIDYIKYDVEGSEKEALLGTKNTIEKYAPTLLVSLYHRSEDIFELPLLVQKLCPDYKLYLRRFPYIPAWDLNLYAVKK